MNIGGDLETSMVGPLVILFDLVREKISKGSSKSGNFFGRPYMSPFIAIIISLEIET